MRARVTKVKRRYGDAVTVETLEQGPDRVEAPCPHFGACGGCRWQDLDYAAQLRHKTSQVRDALERIGHQSDFELDPIVPADPTFGTATRSSSRSDRGARGPALGFHRAGRWDEVLPLEVCLLVGDAVNRAPRTVEAWAAASAA